MICCKVYNYKGRSLGVNKKFKKKDFLKSALSGSLVKSKIVIRKVYFTLQRLI
ncbi:hypothetical protein KsCSTR_06160 [Candidatus Kuenenia stuttgartiensis]|uniref:Uncharacterized protein n=1 Tax=Kuenenia stuttgartiensis TaxID=174633 RepID=Q1PZW7_KUEST|nr:hypothetical protein KsCSTR_06160 [Candidatus Kuenenia stuttgartiensis]CAJ72627.1 unknown protein [Candidatus Kuenenia stuttgartiensis]